MQSIRQGVFETNSSSSHSITVNISPNNRYETVTPASNGALTLNGGDFSKAEFHIQNPMEKANAIAVYCAVTGDEKVWKLFEEVMLKQTGATHIVNNIVLLGPNRNSHMSSWFISYLTEALGSKKDIRDFVFNRSSNIVAVFGYDG